MRLRPTTALLILALSVFATVCEAYTGYPSRSEWGFDDINTASVNPAGAPYLNATPNWFNLALPNSSSQNNVGWNFNTAAQWTFTMAGTLAPAASINSFVYNAWVVSQDPYNLPNGNPAQLYTVNGDVGGANYTLNYVPGANDPGGASSTTTLANVHFLQVVKAISNYGDDATGQVTSTVTQYFIDNAGNANSPWYDGNFSFGYAQNGTQKWMDDSPYRFEDQSGVDGASRDGDPTLLSINWEANVFIAVDLGATTNTQNNVLLYGGRDWGFNYSNTDVPEPAAFALAGIGFVLLIARRSRFGRRASAK